MDALNGVLILDRRMLRYMDRLAPSTGVFDLSKAREISNNILIPAPMVTTIAAYIRESDELYPE